MEHLNPIELISYGTFESNRDECLNGAVVTMHSLLTVSSD